MANSKVYFADFHMDIDDSVLGKFERLLKAAGIDKLDVRDKFVAVKMHFGEYGNMTYLRPGYARSIVDAVKRNGGIPYVTDCNTLYAGRRKNAPEHLETAALNGFTSATLGCNVIISDGVKGDDDVEVPFDGDVIKKAMIGRGIYDADVIITLSHFKCHEMAGIGGTIKNLGMGCASRRGKMVQHSGSKPDSDPSLCRGCGRCIKSCGSDAIMMKDKKAVIDHGKCVGCGLCISSCRFDAISVEYDSCQKELYTKMTEYAGAAVKGKPCFHVSIISDVTPHCDCRTSTDTQIVPNVGMLASLDPVALDAACSDLVMEQPVMPGSVADKNKEGEDIFIRSNPGTEGWVYVLKHAEKMKMGSAKYDLVRVK
jgi:uncharacterized Fe-S center protein